MQVLYLELVKSEVQMIAHPEERAVIGLGTVIFLVFCSCFCL
jgi:hypothetical protein